MDFTFGSADHAFRDEVVAYLDNLQTNGGWDLDEVAREYREDNKELRPLAQRFVRQLGKDGWLGIGVPRDLGGMGRSYVHQWIFLEELKFRCLPTGHLLIQSIIPALCFLADKDMQDRFLPQCLSGETLFAIGYSEPGAGSDLGALRTRAEKVDGGYRLNGQKIWTTNAHYATHLWLAARTGTADSRHGGISLFILPMASPGVSLQPIITQAQERTNHVFFDDVFIPEAQRVGKENEGWALIMAQLNLERLYSISELVFEFRSFLHWWRDNQPSDPSERQFQRHELARMAGDIEVCRLMAMRSACLMDQGHVPQAEASMAKVFYTSAHQRIAIDTTRLSGNLGQLRYGDPHAPAFGRMERAYRGTPAYTFGAGANEIQRDLIANHGMSMPRIR